MKRIALLLFLTALISIPSVAKVMNYTVKVVKEYPHSVNSYTQGLFFYDGVLYESAGQWGESRIHKLNLTSGKAEQEKKFADKYFLEGSTVFDGKLYLLTWTNKVAFIYDPKTLQPIKTVSYPREGWGLTTDGKSLIASDGSSKLYFMDKDLKVLRTVKVTMNGREIHYLNELEWIDGKIWANVYTTDIIVVINPATGIIESTVDCTGLLPAIKRTSRTDVLNGIAYKDGNIYLTGKYWPALYQVKLIEK